jgi:hypothetical protein
MRGWFDDLAAREGGIDRLFYYDDCPLFSSSMNSPLRMLIEDGGITKRP